MKKILAYFCFLLFVAPNNIQAQDTQKVDSLLAIFNNEQSADTLKIKVLGNLYNTYLYSDVEKSKAYLSKALALSKQINYEKGIALCEFQKGVLFDLSGALDSAFLYYSEAKAYYQKVKDTRMLVQANQNLANIAFQKGDYQGAVELTNASIELLRNSRQEGVPLAMSYEMLGRIYDAQGYYKLALENILTAIKLYEKNKNEIRKADATAVLGGIELSLLNYQKSIDYNLEAAKIYEKHNDKFFLAQTNNDIGNTYYYLKDYDKAKQFLMQSIALSKEMEASDLEGTALTNLGKVFSEEGKFEQAIDYLESGLAIHQRSKSNNKLVESLNALGKTYLQFKKPNTAIPILNQAVHLADSIQSMESSKQSYFYRAEVFENLNKNQAALEDYKKFHSLSDTILNKTKISQIEELRILHDTEQKEKEIALLAKNAELDKVKRTRLWISLIAAIGLGSILLWTQWMSRRKEKEIESEKRKVTALENQKLNYELDFKKQELTSKVLQLCRKNEFLQSLEKDVKEFKTETEGNERHRLEKLSRKINRDMDADTDWEQFLKSFETVHPDFNKLVLQKYPNFAPNEIRMACLMRMNLESKDIASLLHVTPDSVKKARYRMRKKMEKDSAVNLTEYFLNFGNS